MCGGGVLIPPPRGIYSLRVCGILRVCMSKRLEGRISDSFLFQINCPGNLMVDV